MSDEETPVLRADATDDDLQLAEGGIISSASNGDDTIPLKLSGCDYILPKKLADKLAIPDSEDAPAAEDGTVDPASPGATSSNGVIHGGL